MSIVAKYRNLEQRTTAEGRQYIVDQVNPKVLYVLYWGTVMAWQPLSVQQDAETLPSDPHSVV